MFHPSLIFTTVVVILWVSWLAIAVYTGTGFLTHSFEACLMALSYSTWLLRELHSALKQDLSSNLYCDSYVVFSYPLGHVDKTYQSRRVHVENLSQALSFL